MFQHKIYRTAIDTYLHYTGCIPSCYSVERGESWGILPADGVLDLGSPPRSLADIVDVVQRLQNDLNVHVGLISEILRS